MRGPSSTRMRPIVGWHRRVLALPGCRGSAVVSSVDCERPSLTLILTRLSPATSMTAVPLQVQFDPASRASARRARRSASRTTGCWSARACSATTACFRGQAWLVLLRSPHAHARITVDRPGSARGAGRDRGLVDGGAARRRRRAHPVSAALQARRRLADGGAAAHAARRGQGVTTSASRWSAIVAETREQAQDAAELVASSTRSCPAWSIRAAAIEAGAPQLLGGGERQRRGRGALRRCRDGRRRRSPSAAHVTELELHNQRLNAMALEPRCAIGVHEGGRTTLYTQNQTPTGARELLGAVFGAKPEDFRVVERRHRRRLRHEDRPHAGGRAGLLRGAQARPAGEVARRAQRGIPRRAHGARPALHARRSRSTATAASSRCAWRCWRNIGAVPVGSSAIIPLAHGRQGADLGLPRAGGRLPRQGRAHEHHGDRRLSRRRPARGQLPDGAADREGGARDGHRPRRAAPAQPASRPTSCPYQHARRRDLRQRRFRAHAASGRCAAADWNGFRRSEARNPRSAASCAGRGAVGLPGMDRRVSDRDGRHRGRAPTAR